MTNTINKESLAGLRKLKPEDQAKWLREAGIKDETVLKEITGDGKIDGGDTRYMNGRVTGQGDKADPTEVSLFNGLKALEAQDALDMPNDEKKTDTTKTDATKTGSTKYPDAGPLADVESGKVTLKKGSGGPAVKETQDLLKQAGYEETKYGSDGKYGQYTEQKVKDFQKDNSLKITGEVDKDTLAKLKEVAAKKTEKVEDKKVDEKKVDEKKVDETKVDDKKVDEKKVDKVDEKKVDEKKVEENKVEENKVDPKLTADQLSRVQNAITGGHERELADVFANASNAEIKAIKDAYKTKNNGAELDAAINKMTFDDPDTKKLIQANLKGTRDESKEVDMNKVRSDANALKQAMQGGGTDNYVLINILSSRSTEHLRALKEYWPEIGGSESLQGWIKGDTSGDFEYSLLSNLNRR